MKNLYKLVSIAILLVVFVSCCNNSNYSKFTFDPMINFRGDDTIFLNMDLSSAVLDGIFIPSVGQTPTGMFEFSANIKQKKGQQYFYKIYYQNDTYKFPESDSLCSENFYGSWEDVSVGFKPLDNVDGNIHDMFRILGNPRDEKIFYGADISKYDASLEKIAEVMSGIKNTPEWFATIKEKANNNGYSVEKQLFLDAQWIINDNRHKEGNINHRWKRNPRTGCYSFMLVVCNEQGLNKIPDYIKFIGNTNENGQFVNPFQWFTQNSCEGITVYNGSKILKTKAVITPKQGVFVDEVNIRTPEYYLNNVGDDCGVDELLYSKALFQQFFPAVSQQYSLRNIPVVKDVVADNNYYTRAEYEQNRTKFDSSQLIYDYPQITNCPCKTVKVSENGDFISLINPGNTDVDNLKKESTGIKTRVGFTYGKFRGKIKFPEMLNKENLWNGLTYAFWLIYQDNHPWNNRRGCFDVGYIDKGDESKDPVRHTFNKYSEIDIEIVKASKFWPQGYYKNKGNYVEDATNNSDVMYCCTNWDLACPQPPKFDHGVTTIPYNGTSYDALRWDNLYKALTIKTPISNDIFKNDFYYYEIEWKPTEIIWRIGPSPDKMIVVGYMNDQYTSIPNNQMLCIITQEYHYSEWWPPIVFEQGLIPYNNSDIEGKVYDVEIE